MTAVTAGRGAGSMTDSSNQLPLLLTLLLLLNKLNPQLPRLPYLSTEPVNKDGRHLRDAPLVAATASTASGDSPGVVEAVAESDTETVPLQEEQQLVAEERCSASSGSHNFEVVATSNT